MYVTVAPCNLGLLEIHWQCNSQEKLCVTSGRARVTVSGLPKANVVRLQRETSSIYGEERIYGTRLSL